MKVPGPGKTFTLKETDVEFRPSPPVDVPRPQRKQVQVAASNLICECCDQRTVFQVGDLLGQPVGEYTISKEHLRQLISLLPRDLRNCPSCNKATTRLFSFWGFTVDECLCFQCLLATVMEIGPSAEHQVIVTPLNNGTRAALQHVFDADNRRHAERLVVHTDAGKELQLF